ncbi:MAG: maltose alpha-D-glucosyltransferase [Anaerolineales bacterium]|nr:maltose alpha-D-glucosyltransferase [Anaerolineales bacterium]
MTKHNIENWYQDAIFYELYGRAYYDSRGDGHGDLKGITQKLDYIKDLGIDCIWLTPIYPSPLKDDGYDISDFYNVHPAFGTLDDFKELIREAHTREIKVIADLVMNHTSDQHPWFQESRKSPDSPYRDYYVWSDSKDKYSDARIIFLDTEESNWTWDEKADQYYWHRFFSSQPDLNYDNPAVREEMLNVARFWLGMGLDGFRADAVPYLFEREGTTGENLPETHAFLKEVRKFVDEQFPGKILLCEANQFPEDVRPYFGDGDEFQMGFHFPLMPRIFMSIRKGDGSSVVDILNRTPPIPEDCQWCTFLRNHDELTLEMVTEEEREWMWQEYAPDPRMKSNLGIRRRLAPLLDNDRRKIELANSLLFTLPGSPIVYYGDEIGMGDNIWLFDRNGVRTPMQWEDGPNGGFSTADPEALYSPMIDNETFGYKKVNVAAQMVDPNSLFHWMKKVIGIRKENPALKSGSFEWVENGGNSAVLSYARRAEVGDLLILNNVSGEFQTVTIDAICQTQYLDILSKDLFPIENEKLEITLSPYQYLWLK